MWDGKQVAPPQKKTKQKRKKAEDDVSRTAPKARRYRDSKKQKRQHNADAAESCAQFKTFRDAALIAARERSSGAGSGGLTIGSEWTRRLQEVCVSPVLRPRVGSPRGFITGRSSQVQRTDEYWLWYSPSRRGEEVSPCFILSYKAANLL